MQEKPSKSYMEIFDEAQARKAKVLYLIMQGYSYKDIMHILSMTKENMQRDMQSLYNRYKPARRSFPSLILRVLEVEQQADKLSCRQMQEQIAESGDFGPWQKYLPRITESGLFAFKRKRHPFPQESATDGTPL